VDVFLETGRLVLRRFTAADADLLVELDSDPAVVRHLTGRPTKRARIAAKVLPSILAGYERPPGLGWFAAHARPDLEFLGWIGLRPDDDRPDVAELGYRLRRAAWGHGYATEGARALVAHAFTRTPVTLVHADTMAVNTASRRVMEKVGLRYESTFFEDWAHPLPGAELGDVRYVLERAAWQAASQRKYLQDLS
jgi:RimJ/RimL family protein N-acetyltransferase